MNDAANSDLAFAALDAIVKLTPAGALLLSKIWAATKEAGGSGEELWDLSRGQRSCARKLIREGLIADHARHGLHATELGCVVALATEEQAGELAGYAVEVSMGK